MNYCPYDFLILDVEHVIEDRIVPRVSIPKEPDPENNNCTEKWKEDQKCIFTILCKATKGKYVGNKIMRMKCKGYDAYSAIIDYVEKYGSEGGTVI